MAPLDQVEGQQSSLLLVLPAELRIPIYEQALASWAPTGRVHVVPASSSRKAPNYAVTDGNFRYVPCLLRPEAEDQKSQARTLHWDACRHVDYLLNDKFQVYPGETLGIFSSCKQTAGEMLPLIHSMFMLDFETWSDAHSFLHTSSDVTLNNIYSLNITGDVPRVPFLLGEYRMPPREMVVEQQLYLGVCSLLCKMSRLNQLRINFRALPKDKLQWEALLQTLDGIKVHGGGGFVVKIPCPRRYVMANEPPPESTISFDERWPFRIESRGWNHKDPLERERQQKIEEERTRHSSNLRLPSPSAISTAVAGWSGITTRMRRILGRG